MFIFLFVGFCVSQFAAAFVLGLGFAFVLEVVVVDVVHMTNVCTGTGIVVVMCAR